MKWFNNLKIHIKILLGFLIVTLITVIIGVQGITNINKISDLDTKLYQKMTAPMGDAITLSNAFNDMRGYSRDVLLTDSNSDIQQYNKEIKEASDEFDSSLDRLSATTLTVQGQQYMKDLKTLKTNYIDVINKMTQLKMEGKDSEAKNLLYNQGKPALEKLQSTLKSYTDLKLQIAKETSDGNDKTASDTTTMTIIILAIGVFLAVLIGLFISSSISRPVKKIMEVADKIADGDFNVNIKLNGKDEIGLLAVSFRKMAENLNDVMYNINSAAEQVSAGSQQISDSGVSLSQGAMEQASSVEELTASIEEITAQTRMNAENASNANEIAINAKSNAEEGYEQMKEMQRAMMDINDASASIYKIIKVIDEIAFQTNILALNAAVEAARAGQHGKGFAVVAEEVRNLAARSANAAKETADMIEGSIRKAEKGTQIADKTAEALNKIVEDTIKVADFIDQISIASTEQAQGIAQINQGIMQVSNVVQTNSATAEESASASEELASQAEMLKAEVKKFKLKV